jgi:wyosine [tRNA(Phe)-imidazoG37] synthetase (radical SAM superfamily)
MNWLCTPCAEQKYKEKTHCYKCGRYGRYLGAGMFMVGG